MSVSPAPRHGLRRLLERTRAGRRGNISLLAAFLLIPIVGLAGLAVDYSSIMQTRSVLDLAADSAALAAVTTAANAYTAGRSSAEQISLGTAAARQWFTAQTLLMGNVGAPTPVISLVQDGTAFQATVSYQANVSLFFGPLFNTRTAAVSDTSIGYIQTNSYVEVTFLVDNSGSMELAAGQTGIDALKPLITSTCFNVSGSTYTTKTKTVTTGSGKKKTTTSYDICGSGSNSTPQPYQACAFACHYLSSSQKVTFDDGTTQTDSFQIARANNIPLRIDAVSQAVGNAITSLINFQAASPLPNQYSARVLTFDGSLKTAAGTIISTSLPASTTSLSTVQTAATSIAPYYGYFDGSTTTGASQTNFDTSLATLSTLLAGTPGGAGNTAASPKRVLIMITDGLNDYNPRTIAVGGSLGPFNPSDCTALRNLGYQIYILYVEYIPDTTQLEGYALQPYLTAGTNGTPSPMLQALQTCAGAAANVYDLSSSAGVSETDAAMQALLKQAIGSAARYTQ